MNKFLQCFKFFLKEFLRFRRVIKAKVPDKRVRKMCDFRFYIEGGDLYDVIYDAERNVYGKEEIDRRFYAANPELYMQEYNNPDTPEERKEYLKGLF